MSSSSEESIPRRPGYRCSVDRDAMDAMDAMRRREHQVRRDFQLMVTANMRAGVDKSVVEQLPTFVLKAGDALAGELNCGVCLEEIVVGDTAKMLSKCGHHFHVECIDMWLFSSTSCPLCRCEVGTMVFPISFNVPNVYEFESDDEDEQWSDALGETDVDMMEVDLPERDNIARREQSLRVSDVIRSWMENLRCRSLSTRDLRNKQWMTVKCLLGSRKHVNSDRER